MKIILGALAAIVVLGAGWMLFSSSSPTGGSETHESATAESASFSGTLAELASRGGVFRCTVSQESDVATTEGVVLVDGGRVRGDFVSTVSAAGGISVETHLIVKDGFTYTWTPIAPNGFKARVADGAGSGSAALSGSYADASQEYAYECAPWTVDESVFELPALTFVEVN